MTYNVFCGTLNPAQSINPIVIDRIVCDVVHVKQSTSGVRVFVCLSGRTK